MVGARVQNVEVRELGLLNTRRAAQRVQCSTVLAVQCSAVRCRTGGETESLSAVARILA